ncbi:hypothetical protein [Usitatibacter palustris]|uniref:Outer membrane lipoprotein-sorting protein n=1 Tax=Usitatibacter palustris TaxID=2732487 RepID=A0A6M4H581_9PROT|nr:hypothetical protein [Usitatibacter palustris]QJR14766.1 hypothetical protein DSM104440_01576 [Usitatibacter palustris]
MRLLAPIALIAFGMPVHAQDAEALAEKMLTALGGRAAWAATTNTVNDSQQNWDGDPSVLRAVITMDFERPRFRIESRGEGLHVIRVIDGDKSWRMTRDGKISAVPPELFADELKWYRGHVYRTLHRIAKRDPVIKLAVGKEGRLEVFEGETRIAWYLLDRANQPYRYGANEDDAGSLFGPWDAEKSGIRHPVYVTRTDGKWRAMLKRLEVNVSLDEALFARP